MNRRRLLPAVLAVALAGVLGACTSSVELPVTCGSVTGEGLDAGSTNARGVIVMVDLFDTTESGHRTMQAALEPFVQAAVRDRAYVTYVVDPGAGRQLHGSECLGAGKRVAGSDPVRAGQVLLDDLSDSVGQERAASVGTPARLLGALPEQVGRLRGLMQNGSAPVEVILWSNLLANDDPGQDCLQVHGLDASTRTARSVVKRCLDSGQLEKFDDVDLELQGVGEGAQLPAQAVMGRLLAEQLCGQVFRCTEV